MRRWENESPLPKEFIPTENVTENLLSTENATENQIPKSKRKRSTLNEEHLLSWNGLKRLYHNFPYRLGGDVAGNEVRVATAN